MSAAPYRFSPVVDRLTKQGRTDTGKDTEQKVMAAKVFTLDLYTALAALLDHLPKNKAATGGVALSP